MKGFIYKITNADESIIYIGSTTMSLWKRWSSHKTNFRRWSEHGIESFNIHLISEHDVEDQRQLCEFEQIVLDQTSNSINYQRVYRTEAQKKEQARLRRINKRDYLSEQYRQYYQEHREAIDQRKIIQKTCECGSSVSSRNMAQHRRSQKHQRLMEQQQS
ncbi:hypothetical protein JG687_00019319 [Phytophthora cactorum]|uniref:GIY-YIG domain-containing protein n=1 Tax=Phytophthora cactorum TaxID=29920 RepID=A0A8T1TM54_9STRA|nr:hypothetical protein JG687_00019319 [Phytophthora cactorum]